MTKHYILADVDERKHCLNLVADSSGNVLVKILNTYGQFIKTVSQSVTSNAANVSVRLDDLSTGVYIVNIFKDNAFIKSLCYSKY